MSQRERQEIEVDALLEVLRDRNIANKVDPELLNFIRDAMVDATIPDDLNRIFNLENI